MKFLKLFKVFVSLLSTVAIISAPIAFVATVSCTTSQQRKTVNSLFTTGSSVDAAYQSYLTLVVQGVLPTNNVPKISKQYREFQAVFNTALTLATLNSNAVASADVLKAANQFTLAVSTEKEKRK